MTTIRVQCTREENVQRYALAEPEDIAEVPLVEYIAGVVAAEVGNASLEAAKAQAVAARTYAWPYYSARKVITDSSRQHQAFRASLAGNSRYTNALQAARETEGLVLCYAGSVLSACPYSASNGGRTVSSEERWSSARPWLIAQDDPWDGRKQRTGHGVGMSQAGAKHMAEAGKTCEEILAFYYPGAKIVDKSEEMEWGRMNDKARETVRAARGKLGCPYVFGAWGDPCTPNLRKKYARLNPEHADNITEKCQVLNGSAAECAGCPYNGKLAFDCRGFTRWVLEQVGIVIGGSGATSQYNAKENWMERGTIDQMPDLPCCVFKRGEGGKTMRHTGWHIGGGDIIHCAAGVQTGRITDRGWTHYAVPAGLYTPEEIAAARRMNIMQTIKKGSKGEEVKRLQTILNLEGRYGTLQVDGIFGTGTAEAVRAFQRDKGLNDDGIVGTMTWAALLEAEAGAGGDDGQDDPADGGSTGEWANIETILNQMRGVHDQQVKLQEQMANLLRDMESTMESGA